MDPSIPTFQTQSNTANRRQAFMARGGSVPGFTSTGSNMRPMRNPQLPNRGQMRIQREFMQAQSQQNPAADQQTLQSGAASLPTSALSQSMNMMRDEDQEEEGSSIIPRSASRRQVAVARGDAYVGSM